VGRQDDEGEDWAPALIWRS